MVEIRTKIQVKRGVYAIATKRSLTLPFESVKVNVVVIRGFNDDQVLPLAALTRARKLAVRFIEFMPFGDNDWKETDWVGWSEVWDRLAVAGYVLSRLNAVRHGLTARSLLLPWEDEAELEALLDALVEEHRPAGPTERHLVAEIAAVLWRQRRVKPTR